jgi:uncharacterized protein (DUF362 family)
LVKTNSDSRLTNLVAGVPRDMSPCHPPPSDEREVTSRKRRRFLALAAGGIAAAAAGGSLALRALRTGGSSGGGATSPAIRSGAAPGASSVAGARAAAPGLVVRVAHPGVVDASGRADAAIALDMVDAAMARLTGKGDRAAAWASLFSRDDVVAIKVNGLAAPALSSHPEIVRAIVAGLRAAGLPDDNIIIYDRLTRELERGGFTPNTGRGVRCYGSDVSGYDAAPTEAGSVGSCLSRIVSESCTAIINVPVVKDHDVAGVSIALKNHFGSINNPNKQHENRCSPQVADVNLFAPIRAKQRLIIADAFTITYDGGPAYKPKTSARYNSILAARDPVALDAVGLEIIEELRRRAGLSTLAAEGRAPKYIAVAADADHKLGVADLSRIQRIDLDLGKRTRS